MATIEYSASAELPADDVFDFLTESGKLARHFPFMADAEGEPRVDPSTHTLSWGEPGRSPSDGSLTVTDEEPGRCVLTVTVHAEQVDEQDLQRGLKETVAAVTHRAAAEGDVSAADDQTGWV